MAFANFGQLKAKVIDWTGRGDLASRVEDFIRYPHDLIVEQMVLTADLELDEASVTLPAECREIVSLWVNADPAVLLQPATAAQMVSAGVGTPRRYRVDSGEVIIAPAPDATYAGRLLYRPVRTFFASDSATNTVLARYPYVYLHGALAEFARFDKDQAAEATWEGRFQAGLVAAIRAERSQGPGGGMLQTQSGVAV